jgi:hypothetical protein
MSEHESWSIMLPVFGKVAMGCWSEHESWSIMLPVFGKVAMASRSDMGPRL